MKPYQLLFAALLSCTLFIGCKKDVQTSEVAKNSSITYKVKINTADTKGGRLHKSNSNRMLVGTVNVTGGYASVSKLIFAGTYNGIGGNFDIDLAPAEKVTLSDVASVAGLIQVPVGTYEKVVLGADFKSEGANAALEITSEYVDGAVTLPIVFRVDAPFQSRITRTTPVTITDSPDLAALITFAVAGLTDGLTEQMLYTAQLTGGKLIISETSNKPIYDIIYANLMDIINIDLN